MDETDRKVLEHWEQNLKAFDGANGIQYRSPFKIRLDNGSCVSVSAYECAYCAKYRTLEGCGECPVRLNTGKDYCRNTPYKHIGKAAWNNNFAELKKQVKMEVKLLKEVVRSKETKDAHR